MIAADGPLDALRVRLEATIQHASELGADLSGLADDLALAFPTLLVVSEEERAATAASLCGVDREFPGHLRRLVERLAEVLGAIATADWEAWLRRELNALSDERGAS